MEPNVIAKGNGMTVVVEGHAIVIHDASGEPGYYCDVFLDKVIFEELQAMCHMAVHMAADMPGDRTYTVAVFVARLFGGEVVASHDAVDGHTGGAE